MLAGRTALMPSDVWTPMITNDTNLRSKSLRTRMKVSHVEHFRRNAKLIPRYAVSATYGNRDRRMQKRFSALRKKRARPQNNFIPTTFGKLLLITQYWMRYAIYKPLNAKDLTMDLTMQFL